MTCDTYVTLTDGTGVVHIAPAFGEDDAKVGRKYDMPFVQLVDEKGDMGETTPFAGHVREEGRPGGHQRPGGERASLRRAEVRAQLSSLLALRYAADLLCARVLVHQDDSGKGRPDPLITTPSTGSRRALEKDVSATGWKMFRTGASAGTVTGEPR